ncbi:MAG: ribonuclease P protein component [Candidatus Pacebacteria bacterium]|nr:ribonuclease P protein component [Candidatus Paceibacterota bacterium]
MVATQNRISRAHFPTYFASGKRFHSEHFTVVYTKATDFRVSVVVSKKVSKSAVDRNRLRRRAYGVVERFGKEHVVSGVYLILCKPGALKATRLALQSQLEALLAQIEKAR